MSDSESFLARWSRRKQGAAAARRQEVKAAEDGERNAAAPAEEAALPADVAPVDPASLPPIESIGPGSDVRAFLQAGVPADLTRAALRRAWSADPDIRDFVGLAENAWDFNAPDSMAGFGPVTADEVRRLLERMTESPAGTESAQTAQSEPEAEAGPPPDNDGTASAAGQDQPRKAQESAAQETVISQRDKENDAAQQNPDNSEYEPVLARRGHGGAVPQ